MDKERGDLPPARKLWLVGEIGLGSIVAMLTWWLVDQAQMKAAALSDIAMPARTPLVKILLIGLTSVILFQRFAISSAAGSAVLILGIVAGGRLASFFSGELEFILLRGANNPVLHALAGSWLALAGAALARGLGPKRR